MFAEIIRAMGGPIALAPSASKNFYSRFSDCPDGESCAIRRVMANVRDSTLFILENASRASAARMEIASDGDGSTIAPLT